MKANRKLDSILKRVERPGRYIGGEINSVCKNVEDVKLRFGFAFPDLYEIGMSYTGMQILYNILNKEAKVFCERIFSPAKDMESIMREENMPLFTLETKTPAADMDIIGFTLQYELSYTNVLNILDLSGIPIWSKERNDSYPLIIAGGPCAFNPEPLADIIDVFLIGDGEELLPELCRLYTSSKEKSENKEEFFKKICGIDGIYVPSFYEPIYNDDGTISDIEKKYNGAPDKIKRALIKNLETSPFSQSPIVPLIDVVHDRAVVETFRGCTRGCRFCQAGIIYRPVRERSSETIKALALSQLESTGHEELSLLSLSTSDYSDFESLVTDLMGTCREQNVSLSLPSLRLDSFSFNVLEEIQKYKKSGLTFAPEAGSQRLRDVINKGITENDIYDAVRQAMELGWNTVKLYFMTGLPTEKPEDLEGIAKIARDLKDMSYQVMGKAGGRFKVTVSVSNFVPKAHTPFQWASQDTVTEMKEKHDFLKNLLNKKGISFHYHDADVSNLEGVFARGDRRTGRVLKRAFESGCRFDGWREYFRNDLWKQAFEDTGIDPDFYNSRERSYTEILPWDIIDSFITKDYLIKENNRALKSETTRDCREGCTNCGMNSHDVCKMEGTK